METTSKETLISSIEILGMPDIGDDEIDARISRLEKYR